MLESFRNLFRRKPADAPDMPPPGPIHKQSWTLGRFDPAPVADRDDPSLVWHYGRANLEAAETNRLNAAHWSAATDRPINEELADHLHTMRIRANHEVWNNPNLEGLVLSHTLAVVGENGPALDIQSENSDGDRWAAEAEQVWDEWCNICDASGQDSLGQRMKVWNRSGWTCGEWLDQLVIDDRATGPVTLRLLEIEPQRLGSPYEWIMYEDFDKVDQSVVLGIRRDRFRRPLEYAIHDTWSLSGPYRVVPARDILHRYNKLESGQARGAPWATTGLPTAADVRDYDDQVMDAARAAADMMLIAFSDHKDAEFTQPDKQSVPFKRRSMRHIAPGWKVAQLQPHQPTATYKDHRHERMGDMGRGQGVPSMITRLDAREHNFSSARFDYGLMHESAKHVRAKLYTPCLDRLSSLVILEATLAGAIRPAPRRWLKSWIWPPMLTIDDQKAANAEKQALENGTLSFTEACKLRFRKPEQVARQRQRDNEMLRRMGLQTIGAATQTESEEPPAPAP